MLCSVEIHNYTSWQAAMSFCSLVAWLAWMVGRLVSSRSIEECADVEPGDTHLWAK